MNSKNVDLILIDAGHGGIDSGAVGNGLLEKNLTLAISQYMYDRLKSLGLPVAMTRTGDEYLPKEERIRRVLELSQDKPNTILISNHINAGGGEGAEVVYSLKNDSTLADLVLNFLGNAGQLKRKTYQRRLPENPNQDYYYILRETGNVEPILVEYGFIDNSVDARRLQNNLQTYANAASNAILEYIGYSSPKEESAADYYVVEKGDTLYSISRRFQIPISEIKRINHLTNDILSIGQKLYFSESNPSEYIVQKGDSLWGISRKYGISVKELIEMNQLDNLTLQIGQVLIVPSVQIDEEVYTVQKGDTLWSIARKQGLSVQELKDLNQLDSNLLSIGQVLKIK
ncbi:MAG: LysM peptidoglycan-binding domain-containing protein [Bacilli bacterium]|nr:LysM peptidoglycan-binding domain-containing protein [Bacilli bacterium]